jgi:hypothetical protein
VNRIVVLYVKTLGLFLSLLGGAVFARVLIGKPIDGSAIGFIASSAIFLVFFSAALVFVRLKIDKDSR